MNSFLSNALNQWCPTVVEKFKEFEVIGAIAAVVAVTCAYKISKSKHHGTCHPLPLKFHSTKGKNIKLEKDGTVAVRRNSFCNGLTFTSRPVAIEERIYVKLVEKCDDWSGMIRVGFTTHDPAGLRDLPKYACPDLTVREGFWAKAVNEKYAIKDAVLYFYVSKNGVVYHGINGGSKEIFFTGVDTSTTLWAVIDVYGNSNVVELVNKRFNNMIPLNMTPDQEAGFDLPIKRSSDTAFYEGVERGMNAITISEEIVSNNQSRNNAITYRPSTSTCRDEPCSSKLNTRPSRDHVKVQQNLKLDPLQFHETHGVNVRLSQDRCIASRAENCHGLGYVFSSSPIKEGEFLIVQILKTNPNLPGCLTFGVTSVDPYEISSRRLPEDADNLMDVIGGYSVTKKEIGKPLKEGDELIFSISRNGDVYMKKNKESQTKVFCIDSTIDLWWLLDIIGSTTKIRAFTGALVDNRTSSVTSVSNTRSWAGSVISEVGRSSGAVISHQSVGNVPVMLVVKCCNKPDAGCSMEPMNIVFQNRPGVQNEIGINVGSSDVIISAQSPHHRLSAPQVADYANIRPVKQHELVDTSVADNGKNREHHLHEWARTKTRNYNSAGSRINECTVCYEKPVDAVLYNCGHMCMCFSCSLELWRGKGDGHCPICRAVIKDVIRTYKS